MWMNLCSSKPVLYLKVALCVLTSRNGLKGFFLTEWKEVTRLCNAGHISPRYQEATACSVKSVPDSTKDT